MDETYITLERHEQKLKMLERDISDLREVQAEIKAMKETLLTLANELKHINEHISKQEKKIEEIDNQPRQRMQQIVTAIIAALSGGLISTILGMILS